MTRVVDGEEADIHEFPWAALILITKAGETSRCGGTLVSDRWGLVALYTTEQCVQVCIDSRALRGQGLRHRCGGYFRYVSGLSHITLSIHIYSRRA